MAEWRSSSIQAGVRCRSHGGQLVVPAVQLYHDLELKCQFIVDIEEILIVSEEIFSDFS